MNPSNGGDSGYGYSRNEPFFYPSVSPYTPQNLPSNPSNTTYYPSDPVQYNPYLNPTPTSNVSSAPYNTGYNPLVNGINSLYPNPLPLPHTFTAQPIAQPVPQATTNVYTESHHYLNPSQVQSPSSNNNYFQESKTAAPPSAPDMFSLLNQYDTLTAVNHLPTATHHQNQQNNAPPPVYPQHQQPQTWNPYPSPPIQTQPPTNVHQQLNTPSYPQPPPPSSTVAPVSPVKLAATGTKPSNSESTNRKYVAPFSSGSVKISKKQKLRTLMAPSGMMDEISSTDGITGSFVVRKKLMTTVATYDLIQNERKLLRATKTWSATKNEWTVTNTGLYSESNTQVAELNFKSKMLGIGDDRATVKISGLSDPLQLDANKKRVTLSHRNQSVAVSDTSLIPGKNNFGIEMHNTTDEEAALAVILLIVGHHVSTH